MQYTVTEIIIFISTPEPVTTLQQIYIISNWKSRIHFQELYRELVNFLYTFLKSKKLYMCSFLYSCLKIPVVSI